MFLAPMRSSPDWRLAWSLLPNLRCSLGHKEHCTTYHGGTSYAERTLL